MKAHRIDTSMTVIVLATSLLSAVGSYAADPYGVSPPSGKGWVVTFEDDFTKDNLHHHTTHLCGAAASFAD